MSWILVVPSVLAILFFVLYWKALSETNAIRAMYIMAVLDSEVCQGQRENITSYLKTITATDAMGVSKQFVVALDSMANKLAESAKGSILLGAHSALWQAFKQAKLTTKV